MPILILTVLLFCTLKEVPLGCWKVLLSEVMYIHHSVYEHVDSLSADECLQAKIAYNDWKRTYSIRKQFICVIESILLK